MPISTDWKSLSDSLESGMKDLLGELIDGSIKELDGPIREISQRMAVAAKRKRMDLVEASRDQLALIVLEKQLRLRVSGEGLFESMLSMGINALINGAVGGLGALRTS